MKKSHILLREDDLAGIVKNMAARIAADFSGRQLQLLGLLKGCQPFMADLSRELFRFHLPLRMFYLHARSYAGRQRTEMVHLTATTLLQDLQPAKPVLLLDDIFDSGETIRQVVTALHSRDNFEIKVGVLLQKEGREDQSGLVDYCGAIVPDVFVVGYGLDYNQQYRELPYIMALDSL